MNMKRMRGRNHRGGSGGGGVVRHQSGNIPLNRNHVFDSSGPDLRIRGTAQQLYEKYLQLGRDATSSGDRVMAESYFQHAEHYFRIVCAMQAAQQPSPQSNNGYQHSRRHHQDSEQPALDTPANHGGEHVPAGMGDQPAAEAARDIPIAAASPET